MASLRLEQSCIKKGVQEKARKLRNLFHLDRLHLHETNKYWNIRSYVPPVQAKKSNGKHHMHKQNSNYIPAGSQVLEQVQHMSLDSIFPAALTVDEQVQQILPDSTTPASQAAHQQVQQESQLPTTPASQGVHEQMQQHRQDSTNFEALPLTKEKEMVHKCKWYMDGVSANRSC